MQLRPWMIYVPGGLGLILLLVGAIIYEVALPSIVRAKVADTIAIKNGTEAYDRFVKMPVPLRWSMYFYQITNVEEFDKSDRSDILKLNFSEIGPYVFEETREKEQLQFSDDGEEITYRERKKYRFLPEESKMNGKQLNQTDKLKVVNPMYGLSDVLMQWVKPFADALTSIAFEESVENMAFKGIQSLMGQSLFGQANVLEEEKIVKTGINNIDELLQIISFDNKTRQQAWNEPGRCNDLRGTDATQFKPDLDHDSRVYAFEPMLCKIIEFANDESLASSGTFRDIDYIRYYATDDNFARNAANACHCFEKSLDDCPGDMINLKKCGLAKDKMNILASSPYFQPNPKLLERTSIKPVKKNNYVNYGTILDIEPTTGLVIRAFKRIQLSIEIVNKKVPFMSNLPQEKVFIPLGWIEESGDIDDENAEKLKDQAIRPRRLASGLLIAMMSIGGILLLVGLGLTLYKVFS